MADIIRIGSGAPRIPLRRADDLLERIATLKADAEARGFGTLAYFLETARMEAQLQAERIAEANDMRERKPEELYRPIEDRD